jgi:L-seryl-tRNA(Ser) seleniumtransferase
MINEISKIPQVETLLSDPLVEVWQSRIGRPMVVEVVRIILDKIRLGAIEGSNVPDRGVIISYIEKACDARYRSRSIPVVNCTGVLIHTNLGRSPLSEQVWNRAKKANCGYASVEFNLNTGKRGDRSSIISDLMKALVGSESALLVNNNAAAVFLILSTFAKGKEVVISRGELVQIGGGFRIPDILEQSGATLVEVGTTNITTVNDYLEHINENTAMVLRVHPSNFAIRGFSSTPSLQQLASKLPSHVILAVDQGSGVVSNDIPGEQSIHECLKQGAHLVSFSGDKTLGSVQSGYIVGKHSLIHSLAKHPLYRVVRPGKSILSLSEEALIDRLNGEDGVSLALSRRTITQLSAIGKKIIEELDPRKVSLIDAPMTLGGGSTPDETIPGMALEIQSKKKAQKILDELRELPIPIIGTIYQDTVRLHLAAVTECEIPIIREALVTLLETSSCI